MSTIQVLDKTFEPYLKEAAIQEKITELAVQLNQDYAGKRPLFLSVLNGSFLFTADLFKQITIEAEVSFIKLASYKGTSSTGNVITAIGLDINVKDRHIIILEDIIDTGKTLHHYLPQLESMQPASVKIAVLLNLVLKFVIIESKVLLFFGFFTFVNSLFSFLAKNFNLLSF